MSYEYQSYRSKIFTEAGTKTLLEVRDRVRRLIKEAGAVRMQEATSYVSAEDSWILLACVDYLVEKGEIRELVQPCKCGQDRVFVAKE